MSPFYLVPAQARDDPHAVRRSTRRRERRIFFRNPDTGEWSDISN
jgi:hypothetical protein